MSVKKPQTNVTISKNLELVLIIYILGIYLSHCNEYLLMKKSVSMNENIIVHPNLKQSNRRINHTS